MKIVIRKSFCNNPDFRGGQNFASRF